VTAIGPGCTHESPDGVFSCELTDGHDGPHRVRYCDAPDKKWTDGGEWIDR